MLTDIEIIKQSKMKNIKEVMKGYDILEDEVSSYGKNIAKIDLSLLNRLENKNEFEIITILVLILFKNQ